MAENSISNWTRRSLIDTGMLKTTPFTSKNLVERYFALNAKINTLKVEVDYLLNGFCVKIVLVRVYNQQFQETILFDYLQASILRQKGTPFGILRLEIRIPHPLKFQFFGGVSRCPSRFNQMVSRIKDAQ